MFAAAHYAALAVFVAACWGFGRALLSRLGALPRRDAGLEAAIATALGIGLFICAFQALAIGGVFRPGLVVALLVAGVAVAGLQLPAWRRELRALRAARGPAGDAAATWTRIDMLAMAALALVALPALVAPLAPPIAFDELMYHLPYARQVAQGGSLGIYEWLRYPWFPYNYNLLYAAALQLGDDVLPHFLNGLAGVLSVCMVYRLGMLHASRLTACIGAAIWLGLGDYSNALIDLGVALFVLSACVALWWWRESLPAQAGAQRNGHGTRWLALAAFFLGVAAGSKYQALTFLPLVALFVGRRERSPRAWALALLCFLIPCIYWYARNAITTGDPFNPIGARLFGFTNWTPADYRQQVDDVRVHAALPSVLIWAAVLAPFSAAWKRSPAVRAAGWFCVYSVAVWLLTSRYPRYLTASVPLLALCSALGWQVLVGWTMAGLRRLFAPRAAGGGAAAAGTAAAAGRLGLGGSLAATVLLLALASASVLQTARKTAMISPTPETRAAFLRKNVPGYAVMDYLRQHASGRVYQVALSEAIYYGPNPIWGDALGPWRYTDFGQLSAADLARKLASLGFAAIAIPADVAPALSGKPDFDRHFPLLYEKDGSRAYGILPGSNTPLVP